MRLKDDGSGLTTGTQAFCRYIMKRISNNKNFLCCVTGSTGSGKSYAVLSLMEILNPDKTPEELIKNVAFDAHEYMARVNSGELSSGDTLTWDESGVGLSSRNWQSLANKSINYLLQTYRNMNLIGFFTLPYFTFLDNNSRKLMHSLMQTQGIDRAEKSCILKPFILHISQQSGKQYNPYLKVKSANGQTLKVQRLKIPLASARLIELYEEKKSKFTEKLNKDIESKLDTAHKKEKKEIDNLTDRQREVVGLYEQGFNMEEVGDMLNISSSNVSQIIRAAKMRGKVIKKVKKPIEKAVFQVENIVSPQPQFKVDMTAIVN